MKFTAKNIGENFRFYRPVLFAVGFYLVVLAASQLIVRLEIRSTSLLYGELLLSIIVVIGSFKFFTAKTDRHMKHLGSVGVISPGHLAICWVAVMLALNWWNSLLFVTTEPETELFTDKMDRLHASTYQLVLADNAQTLSLDGDVAHGVTKAVTQKLQENPQVNQFRLTSSGGNIFEARGLAKLVTRHGLSTLVDGECSSACTIIFMAGKHRTITNGSRLGFHQYALQGHKFGQTINIAEQQEQDLEFFRQQGVSEPFLKRVFESNSTQMWFPTHAELRDGGVIAD